MCSLGVVFFAFVPEVVSASRVEPQRAWQISSLALALYHLATIINAAWRRRRVSRSEDPLVWRLLSFLLAGGGIALVAALFAAGLGFLERWLVFLYLVNLLWMLLVAVIFFALLLFDIVSSESTPEES